MTRNIRLALCSTCLLLLACSSASAQVYGPAPASRPSLLNPFSWFNPSYGSNYNTVGYGSTCPNGRCGTTSNGYTAYSNYGHTGYGVANSTCPNGQCSTGQCANGQCANGNCSGMNCANGVCTPAGGVAPYYPTTPSVTVPRSTNYPPAVPNYNQPSVNGAPAGSPYYSTLPAHRPVSTPVYPQQYQYPQQVPQQYQYPQQFPQQYQYQYQYPQPYSAPVRGRAADLPEFNSTIEYGLNLR